MKNSKFLFSLTISLVLNGSLISYYYFSIKKDTTPYFHPFKINLDVTDESLYKNGYSNFPEDVPIVDKTINDTSIRFQLVYDCFERETNFFDKPQQIEEGEKNLEIVTNYKYVYY